jgi:hypothetical protein
MQDSKTMYWSNKFRQALLVEALTACMASVAGASSQETVSPLDLQRMPENGFPPLAPVEERVGMDIKRPHR